MGNIIKFKDILNGDYNTTSDNNIDDLDQKYRLTDIDNPEGWDFSEIDMLGDMGFTIDNDTDMMIVLDIPAIDIMQEQDEQKEIRVYKTKEGYVLKTDSRNYVFETFEDMINFINK